MARALVAYDSAYGNTEQIARAICDTLAAREDVTILRVADVMPDQLEGLELLVVGSPTQGFRPTRATKDFLKRVPTGGLRGVKVAAFDTRIILTETTPSVLRIMAGWFGYAADPIAASLKKKSGTLAVPPEGFFVEGTEGPLKDGELERAAKWARQVAAAN